MIEALFSIWWFWVALALVLGLVELFTPTFIFLGFSLGALATGAYVGLATAPSVPALLAVFAIVSLLAWVGLRVVFRKQSSGAKIFTKDVND